MIGVLVVDDHAMMRKTLRALLDAESTLRYVGEAGDGLEAFHLTQDVGLTWCSCLPICLA